MIINLRAKTTVRRIIGNYTVGNGALSVGVTYSAFAALADARRLRVKARW
jgi:hypothetical protein